MGRNLKLDDQGNIQFFEGTGGGTNKVTVQAGATLTADYTLTLPDNDGGASQFLQTNGSGVLTWANSTASLDSAYSVGSTVAVDTGAIVLNTTASIVTLDINKTDAGAGNCVDIVNDGTGYGLHIDQQGASQCINLEQNGVGRALEIAQAADAAGIYLDKTGLGVGVGLQVINAGTGIGVDINQTGDAIALDVDQDGTGVVGVNINQAGAAAALAITAGAATGVTVGQANDNVAVSIIKTGTGANDAVTIENDGTGTGLFVNQDGTGRACWFTSAAAATLPTLYAVQEGASDCLSLVRTNVGGGGSAIDATNAGTGVGCIIRQNGAGIGYQIVQAGEARGFYITKTAVGASDAMEIDNDGTGNACLLNQDGNGIALSIDSEATSQPLIELAPVTGNARGDIAFGTARVASPASPSEGDFWYDGTAHRLEMDIGFPADASGKRVVVSRFGPNLGLSQIKPIVSGVITATAAHQVLRAESGTADTLDTITVSGPLIGDTLLLRAESGDAITIGNTTGNINLDGANCLLSTINDNLFLFLNENGDWVEISRVQSAVA